MSKSRLTAKRETEIREIALIRYEMGIFEAPVFIEELLAEIDALRAENSKLLAVADAARYLVDICDCGCACGYHYEYSTEETGMDICGLCGTKEALAALDDGKDGEK